MDIRLPQAENQYIGFKSESIKPMELAEEIVAFANGEGGEIWLGVEDDGTVSGLSCSHEEDVMNICRTACIPPIVAQYETLEYEGKQVARILISRGKDKPYLHQSAEILRTSGEHQTGGFERRINPAVSSLGRSPL